MSPTKARVNRRYAEPNSTSASTAKGTAVRKALTVSRNSDFNISTRVCRNCWISSLISMIKPAKLRSSVRTALNSFMAGPPDSQRNSYREGGDSHGANDVQGVLIDHMPASNSRVLEPDPNCSYHFSVGAARPATSRSLNLVHSPAY